MIRIHLSTALFMLLALSTLFSTSLASQDPAKTSESSDETVDVPVLTLSDYKQKIQGTNSLILHHTTKEGKCPYCKDVLEIAKSIAKMLKHAEDAPSIFTFDEAQGMINPKDDQQPMPRFELRLVDGRRCVTENEGSVKNLIAWLDKRINQKIRKSSYLDDKASILEALKVGKQEYSLAVVFSGPKMSELIDELHKEENYNYWDLLFFDGNEQLEAKESLEIRSTYGSVMAEEIKTLQELKNWLDKQIKNTIKRFGNKLEEKYFAAIRYDFVRLIAITDDVKILEKIQKWRYEEQKAETDKDLAIFSAPTNSSSTDSIVESFRLNVNMSRGFDIWLAFSVEQDHGQDAVEKYRLDFEGKEVDSATLDSFIQAYHDGKLERAYQSQPLDYEQKKNGVFLAVGKNFYDLVEEFPGATLALFFASSCQYSAETAPIIDSLSNEFDSLREEGKLRFLAIDGRHNQIPHLEVEGFPTVFLFFKKDGKRRRKEYSGNRSILSFIEFIKETLPELTEKIDNLVAGFDKEKYGDLTPAEEEEVDFEELMKQFEDSENQEDAQENDDLKQDL